MKKLFTKIRNKYLVWRFKYGGGHTVIFDTDKVLRSDDKTWVCQFTDDFKTWWWTTKLAEQDHETILYLDWMMLERHEVRFSHPEDATLFKLIWS